MMYATWLLVVLTLWPGALVHAQTATTTSTSTSSTTLALSRKIWAAEHAWAADHPGRGPTDHERKAIVDEARKLPPGQVKKIEKDHKLRQGDDS